MLPISLLYPFKWRLARLLCSDTVTHFVTLQTGLALSMQLRLTLNSRPSWLGFSNQVPLISGVVSQARLLFLSGEMTHRTWFGCACVRTRVWITSPPPNHAHTCRCEDVQLWLRSWGAHSLPGSYSNQTGRVLVSETKSEKGLRLLSWYPWPLRGPVSTYTKKSLLRFKTSLCHICCLLWKREICISFQICWIRTFYCVNHKYKVST